MWPSPPRHYYFAKDGSWDAHQGKDFVKDQSAAQKCNPPLVVKSLHPPAAVAVDDVR